MCRSFILTSTSQACNRAARARSPSTTFLPRRIIPAYCYRPLVSADGGAQLLARSIRLRRSVRRTCLIWKRDLKLTSSCSPPVRRRSRPLLLPASEQSHAPFVGPNVCPLYVRASHKRVSSYTDPLSPAELLPSSFLRSIQLSGP